MKRFFYSVLAAATMLFATTSCSQDEEIVSGGTTQSGTTQKVKFSVQLPDQTESRAIAEGVEVSQANMANKLAWALYEKGKEDTLLDTGTATKEKDGKEFTVNIDMVKGLEYNVLFLAYNEGGTIFDVTTGDDLRTLNYKSTTLEANKETYDAFVACHPYNTLDASRSNTVTLVRPFAQINAGTTDDDLTKAVKLGAVVTNSELVIEKVPTQYDVLTGKVSKNQDVTFAKSKILYQTNTTTNELLKNVDGQDYNYLNMVYVLAGKDEHDSSNHDATFTFYRDEDPQLIRTIDIPNLPIQRNYRTNVVGDLITRTESFKVIIDADFKGDINKIGVINGETYIKVANAEEFNAAFANDKYDIIILENDIVLTESAERRSADDPTLIIDAEKKLTIDLNGKKLSSTSSETGKNYNMFDVRGTLTVKNGTVEYKHNGGNMEWNNFAEIFYVGFNGTLNLDGVIAKNLGGSDMAYVIDMVNATNITVNVDNSTLKSTYIPIRVFNNTKDGVNNVVIKNSTLEGMYCFWVQYYLSDGRDQETLDKTLNLDIFDDSVTFTYTNDKAPVLFGFDDPIYLDKNGNEIIFNKESLAKALTANKENISVVLANDIDLPISSLGTITGGSGEYKLGGENTKSININLNEKKLNITTTYWSNLGAKNDDAIFTIKNGTMTSSQETGTWNSYDLCFSNCNYVIEDVVFDKAISFGNANRTVSLKDVTITETHDYYAMWIEAVGQNVTIDGLTINSDGRGIKIDEQYIETPAKVTLNINNAKFTTVKKAAIVVKSAAGAEINWGEGNDISNVAADTECEVWVDADAAEHADKVVVNGARKAIERTVVSDGNGLVEAFKEGGNVVLKGDITLTGRLELAEGANVNLDMNGKTITLEGTSADPAFYTYKGSTLTITGNGTVEIKDPSVSLMFPGGDVVIENGTFVRNVPAGTPVDKVGAFFVGAKVSPWGSQTVTIKGGYFDGGYYDANAADVDDILAGTMEFEETADDQAKRGNSKDANKVRVALKNNIFRFLNLSYNLFKIYGGTFVGANPAWGDEGCMLPTTPNYLRPWSYYQGALLDGQTFNENGIVLPDGYEITKGATEDGRPTYTVKYSK